MRAPMRLNEAGAGGLPAETSGKGLSDIQHAPAETESPNLRAPLAIGVFILFLFFGVFSVWAAMAPLDSAAIAPGMIVVSGNRRQVQHFEGGIVADIFVREGDHVTEGDDLIVLQSIQADASLGQLKKRLVYAVARETRLKAERAGETSVEFPDWLEKRRSDFEVRDALIAEETALRAANQVKQDQIGIWRSRIRQLEEENKGLQDEIQSNNDQLVLISEEIKDQQFLVDRGLGIKRVLLGLKRQATEIRGRRARSEAGIARNKQSISESELRIAELQQARLTEIDNELNQLSSEIAGLQERIRAAEDVQARTLVKAPVSGKVVNLKAHTRSGVVRPGDVLMEIVPDDDDLIVAARVNPGDIDVVHDGLSAQVRLSAYPGRTAPVLDAVVDTVSADLLTDERSGASYYEARVRLPADDPQLEGLSLHPGMPAEVSIVTGEQTFFNTLFRPITDTMRRGMTQN